MKKIILLFMIAFYANFSFGQIPSWFWASSSGSDIYNETASSATIDNDGNIIVVGQFAASPVTFGSITLNNVNSNGYTDIFIVKYSPSGDVIWAKSIGGSENDEATAVKSDGSGNLFIAGDFEGTLVLGNDILYSKGLSDLFIAKFDANGNPIWAKSTGGTNIDKITALSLNINNEITAVGVHHSGNIIFGNDTLTNYTSSSYNSFVVQYDTIGNVKWVHQAFGTSNANTVCTDDSGNVYIAGVFNDHLISFGTDTIINSNTSYPEIFIAKYSYWGNEIWAKSIKGMYDDNATSLIRDNSGMFILTGYFGSPFISFNLDTITNSGDHDIFILKFNEVGNTVWFRSDGGYSYDEASSIAVNNYNDIYISGRFEASPAQFCGSTFTNAGGDDIFLAKYKNDGSNVWAKVIGGSGNEQSHCINISTTGNLYMVGSFSSNSLIFDSLLIYSEGFNDMFIANLYDSISYPQCQAEFLYNATLLNCGPYCVQFFDSSYAASAINSWLWTFSDSTSSTLQNPSHTFPGYGSYNVCLTIQTANGCSSTNCQQINVQYPAFCQAGFSYYLDSLNTTNPYTFNFVNQSTTDSLNTIVGYSWNFSDGTNSTLANPTHVFNFTANYEVCLTIITANGCTNTYCDSVLVTNAPCTIFASVNTQSPSTIGGNDGYIESSTSGGTPPYSYNWSNNETTQNIYNLTSGGYILTITDANGCQNILSAALYEPYDTTGGPIVDTLYTNVIDTCLNFVPDSFYVSSIVIDTVNQTATITWTFSNNSQTSSVTAIYIYTQLGNNMIVLTLNCGTKTLTTYQSYVHITSNLSAPVNNYYTNVSAYPVPFNDKLIINYTSQKSDNTTILLMDATGRIVVSEKIISIIGSNYSEINTSQLPSGIYILSIETKDGIFRKQVVK